MLMHNKKFPGDRSIGRMKALYFQVVLLLSFSMSANTILPPSEHIRCESIFADEFLDLYGILRPSDREWIFLKERQFI